MKFHGVVFVLLSSALSLSIADVLTVDETTRLTEFVENLMECRGIVGLTMAVVKGNETWTHGFGEADLATGRKVNSSTLFGIGSVTKAFTTAILSLFINETGKYSWQTPIKDILGEDFRFYNEELTQHTTLKDILTHRTGLETTNIPMFAGMTFSPAEYASNIRYLPAKQQFRDAWDYNNWMYGLAGYVAEKMGGATWEELLRTHIFNPLGMTHSGVLEQTVSTEDGNVAKPYVMVGDKVVLSDPSIYRISPSEAAGAIASSAEDMAKWMVMLLNHGTTPSGLLVLNDTLLRQMTTAHVTLPDDFRSRVNLWKPAFPVSFENEGYGYGWMVGSYRGYPARMHSGGIFGYITYLALLPHLDFGFFVSTSGPGNSNASHIIRQLFYYTADLALGEEPWQDLNNSCHYPDYWVNSTVAPPSNHTSEYYSRDFENSDRFIGTYQHRLYGKVEIEKNGTKGLAFRYGRINGLLRSTGDDHITMGEIFGFWEFMSRPGNKTMYMNYTFSRLDGGEYQEVTLSVPELGMPEELLFQRHLREETGGSPKPSIRATLVLFLTALVLLLPLSGFI